MNKFFAALLFGWWLYLIFAGADKTVLVGLAIVIMIVETSGKGKGR